MMTEQEAKAKWCPAARVVEKFHDGVTAPRNRVVVCHADGEPIAKLASALAGACCIGSACMAWRWQDFRMTANYAFPDNDAGKRLEKDGWRFVGIEGGFGCIAIWERRTDRGFCGLAGKP